MVRHQHVVAAAERPHRLLFDVTLPRCKKGVANPLLRLCENGHADVAAAQALSDRALRKIRRTTPTAVHAHVRGRRGRALAARATRRSQLSLWMHQSAVRVQLSERRSARERSLCAVAASRIQRKHRRAARRRQQRQHEQFLQQLRAVAEHPRSSSGGALGRSPGRAPRTRCSERLLLEAPRSRHLRLPQRRDAVPRVLQVPGRRRSLAAAAFDELLPRNDGSR